MVEAALDLLNRKITLHAEIITYGNAADEAVTIRIIEEIEHMWNEPMSVVPLDKKAFRIQFRIEGRCIPHLDPLQIVSNTDPRKNFFRIEEKAMQNISFVDGLGCNSGYFQLDNLYLGSTTAAHEFGHTIGLDHPYDIDLRGKGKPGIMYPRGTLVDPIFQYDPGVPAGEVGGTLHPMHRKVRQEDIDLLNFHTLKFNKNVAIIGEFSNVYHPDHSKWITINQS